MSERDVLLEKRILPRHVVYQAERLCCGEITVISATRNSARVQHESSKREWSFYFSRGDLVSYGIPDDITAESAAIVSFAWHRAAEAMRAVRKGHAEAVERKRQAKLIKQQQEQTQNRSLRAYA